MQSSQYAPLFPCNHLPRRSAIVTVASLVASRMGHVHLDLRSHVAGVLSGRRFRCTMRVDGERRLVDPCRGDLRRHSDVRRLRRRYCDGRGDRIANAGGNAQPPRRGASFGYPGRMQRELPNLFQISLRLATFEGSCCRKEARLVLECRAPLSQATSRLHSAALAWSGRVGIWPHRPVSEATSAFGQPAS
jgi:hypothetical protein